MLPHWSLGSVLCTIGWNYWMNRGMYTQALYLCVIDNLSYTQTQTRTAHTLTCCMHNEKSEQNSIPFHRAKTWKRRIEGIFVDNFYTYRWHWTELTIEFVQAKWNLIELLAKQQWQQSEASANCRYCCCCCGGDDGLVVVATAVFIATTFAGFIFIPFDWIGWVKVHVTYDVHLALCMYARVCLFRFPPAFSFLSHLSFCFWYPVRCKYVYIYACIWLPILEPQSQQ